MTMVQMWPVAQGINHGFSVLDVVVYQEDLGSFHAQILRFGPFTPDSFRICFFRTKRRI